MAEAMLQRIHPLNIIHRKNPFGIVTISIGLKCVSAHESTDLQTIYKLAEEALYEAKQAGRNRFLTVDRPPDFDQK